MKKLLSSEDLVDYLESKNVRFNINHSKEDAIVFFKQNNYYMKLCSYRKNYDKDSNNNYINLDFSHLVDLSTIDMHLRYLIIKMCLDIEHFLKVQLLQSIENEPDEDGYQIIKDFLTFKSKPNLKNNMKILNTLEYRINSGSYARELINKYHPYYPAWVFVEIISFGNLTYLCNFYNNRCKSRQLNNHFLNGNYNNKILNNIRDLRNASAHNNCLIYDLRSTRYKYDKYKEGHLVWNDIQEINDFLINNDFKKNTRKNKLSNRFIKDFICLLYGYNTIIPDSLLKERRFKELKELMNTRMIKNKDFYLHVDVITTSYKFIYKVINILSPSQT